MVQFIWENLKIIKKMELECIDGQMEQHIMENGKIIIWKDFAILNLLMIEDMKDK